MEQKVIMILQHLLFRIDKIAKKKYLQRPRQVNVSDFSIISNNCWGGIVYRDLNLPYNTPFVNMFMFAECYVKILSNLRGYLAHPLQITYRSKYFGGEVKYPIGLLNDAEIHFIHYTMADNVIEKWTSRVQRINYDRLIVVMSERDGVQLQHLQAFDALPYEYKVAFTQKPEKFSTVKNFSSLLWRWGVPPADQMTGTSYHVLNLAEYLNSVLAVSHHG